MSTDSNTPSVFLSDPDVTLWHGDMLATLRELPAESVDCVVTSPPYWGLRDYGQEGQLGLEPTPEQYVERMVEVFREVRRVLAAHGTVWLNLGDSYAANGRISEGHAGKHQGYGVAGAVNQRRLPGGLKEKDLVGIPWRVAFALQADGWYLRSDIIWAKPNPMPESVTDRPTKAHEYVFLLSKQARYFFDQEAVREAANWPRPRWSDEHVLKHDQGNGKAVTGLSPHTGLHSHVTTGRNIRSVWEIATQPYPEAHFATFPEELARRCIAAGCPEQVCRVCGKARERVVESNATANARNERIADYDVPGLEKRTSHDRVRRLDGKNYEHVRRPTGGWSFCAHSTIPANLRPGITLDPFIGSGTVAFVARKLGRHAIGIDLNESYLELAARRLSQQSLFAQEAASEQEPYEAFAASQGAFIGGPHPADEEAVSGL